MIPETYIALCSGLCCLSIHERRYLWYAGAATSWISAAVLSVVGLFSRRWSRSGRDAYLFLIAHFTIVVAGAIVLTPPDSGAARETIVLPLVIFACVIVGMSLSLALLFAATWALVRARRLEKLPPTNTRPGAERFFIYLGCLLFWPGGLLTIGLFDKPQNARVGAIALCCSLSQLWVIAVAVCVAVPLFLAAYSPY